MTVPKVARPILPLSPLAGDPHSGRLDPRALRRASGALPLSMRSGVATYLRSCPVFLAWMEYTRDVLEDRFGVSGGSAVVSDGRYYWRLDGADYVEHYGTGLPEPFLQEGQAHDWSPPTFDRAQYASISVALDRLAEPADLQVFDPDRS